MKASYPIVPEVSRITTTPRRIVDTLYTHPSRGPRTAGQLRDRCTSIEQHRRRVGEGNDVVKTVLGWFVLRWC